MKQILIVISLLFFLFNSNSAIGQKAGKKIKTYEKLNLIYVDNSHEGMTPELSDRIKSKIDSANSEKNTKFLLYISNGRDYLTCDKPSVCKEPLKMLYDPLPLSQDLIDDKENLRKLLFNEEFKLNKEINAGFFLASKTLKDLEARPEPSFLVNMLAQEIAFFSGLESGKLNLTIYYSGDIKNNLTNIRNFYKSNPRSVETQINFVKI